MVAAVYPPVAGMTPIRFGDISVKDWLGLVVSIGGAYGVVYAAPRNAEPAA